MPHAGFADSVTNDGPGFHSNMPVSELTERVTLAIEASDVSSTPPVVETTDGVMHKTQPTPTKPNGAWGLEPPNPNSGIQPTKVRRPAHKVLEATSYQIEPGEKTQMSPSGLCPTHSEVDRIISTFSFDPNLELCPHNLHRGEANGPPKSVSEMTRASTRRWVKEQWNAT